MLPQEGQEEVTTVYWKVLKDEVDLEAGMDRSGLSHLGNSLLLGHLTYSVDDRERFLGLRKPGKKGGMGLE